MREANQARAALALSLWEKGCDRGVFKLDVEVYEPVVLASILECFKLGFRFMVLMECQSDGREIQALVERHGSGRLFQVSEYPQRGGQHWSRGLRVLFAGGRQWRLAPYARQARKTDLVYFSFER